MRLRRRPRMCFRSSTIPGSGRALARARPRRSEPATLRARAGRRSWSVEDRLDVVPVGIEDERGVVVAAVLGTHTRGSDVGPAMAHCRVVPAHDRAGVAGAEGEMRTGG